MDVAQFPAGWYRDPTARHEQRYWDGTRWGTQVLDQGHTFDDPTGVLPFADTVATARATGRQGYRVIRVPAWRVAIAGIVPVAAVLALMFEVLASVMAYGASWTRDESWLALISWLYSAPSSLGGAMYVGYPPLAIFGALILALAFFSGVTVRPESALVKAGAKRARIWSPATDAYAWEQSLARMRLQTGSNRLFNTLLRPHARIFLVLEILTGAVIVLVSYIAIAQRKAMMVYGQQVPVGELDVGWGPWLCLVTGVLLIAGALLAWPLRPRQLVIRADGSVDELGPV